MFVCMGGDCVIVTVGETKFPQRDLSPVAPFIYLAPVGLHVIASFFVGVNINFMDHDLYHPWAKPDPNAHQISHSPFIIAIRHTSIGTLVIYSTYSSSTSSSAIF